MPAVTGTPTTFGGIGKLEFAPTNNPDDPNPTYVDITPFLRTEDTPLDITRGRQSELDTIQSSQLTCVLDNSDNRFTFGLTTGPYGSNWAPAKKVRYSETIGSQTFVLYTGYIEYPDITEWHPIGYHEVQLTCTDRLTRLSRGAPFISTLAAHIAFNGGAALKAYWPLGEAAAPVTSVAGALYPLVPTFVSNAPGTGFLPGTPSSPSISYGAGAPPVGDDLSVVALQPVPIAGSPNNALFSYELVGPLPGGNVVLSAGQVITMVLWVNFADFNLGPNLFWIRSPTGGDLSLFFFPTVGTVLHGRCSTGSGFGPIDIGGDAPRLSTWTPIAVRAGFSPAVAELWTKDAVYTGVMPVTAPATTTYTQMIIGNAVNGAVGHVQVYIGAPSDWDHTKFLAQTRMGFDGLEYQTTGQRINTILDYAGVPGDQRLVDPGVSYMQRAQLAGVSPGDALANAVATERGRGFIDGQGRYVFHDRIRVYNV